MKIAEQILALHQELLAIGQPDILLEKPKYKLVLDRQTLKLLSGKIIMPLSRVMNKFRIKEVNLLHGEYDLYLDEDTVVLMIIDEKEREILEQDERIAVRYLYASKMYPVSSRNTKWIKSNQTSISLEEFNRLPKIKMRKYNRDDDENVLLETDDATIYSEAILNDYGVGTLAMFAPDIYVANYDKFKIYEPFDVEIYIVMLYSNGSSKEKVLLLEDLMKN